MDEVPVLLAGRPKVLATPREEMFTRSDDHMSFTHLATSGPRSNFYYDPKQELYYSASNDPSMISRPSNSCCISTQAASSLLWQSLGSFYSYT